MQPFYVNMHDTFMSGWGNAKHGRSLYCVECNTRKQADAILKAAKDRWEMKYVSLAMSPRKGRANDQRTIRHVSELGGPWLKYMDAETKASIQPLPEQ